LHHFVLEEVIIGISISNSSSSEVETIYEPCAGDIIIDIRHPADVDARPLRSGKNKLLVIPFFKLEQQLDQLNKNLCYLLYCEKGIMSRLQAILMCEKGFNQVKIFSTKT
jgi:thiamine biosynthesis protein ThiI